MNHLSLFPTIASLIRYLSVINKTSLHYNTGFPFCISFMKFLWLIQIEKVTVQESIKYYSAPLCSVL